MRKYIIYRVKKSPYGDRKLYFVNGAYNWSGDQEDADEFDSENAAMLAFSLRGFRMGTATRCEPKVLKLGNGPMIVIESDPEHCHQHTVPADRLKTKL